MRRLRSALSVWIVLLCGTTLLPCASAHNFPVVSSQQVLHASIDRAPEATYFIEAGFDGDIFPAFANYASRQRPWERPFGTLGVTITNSSNDRLCRRISVKIPGWSDQELQNVCVRSGQVRKLLFAPGFSPRLYTNRETASATAVVTVTSNTGEVIQAERLPVRLHPTNEIYWGPEARFAPIIAAWVMPRDPLVESILTRASRMVHDGYLPGYEEWESARKQRAMTCKQLKALYRAVEQLGPSYGRNSVAFGLNSEVSEPFRNPANSIDGSVMFASMLENLGMDPVIILVPGHAYIGVREGAKSQNFIYLETASTASMSFEKAVKAATFGINQYKEADIIRIPISQARAAGIYPMPLNGQDERQLPVAEAVASTPASP